MFGMRALAFIEKHKPDPSEPGGRPPHTKSTLAADNCVNVLRRERLRIDGLRVDGFECVALCVVLFDGWGHIKSERHHAHTLTQDLHKPQSIQYTGADAWRGQIVGRCVRKLRQRISEHWPHAKVCVCVLTFPAGWLRLLSDRDTYV